jgi:hypothetical protein
MCVMHVRDQGALLVALQRRLLHLVGSHEDESYVAMRKAKRREDRAALKQWRATLGRLTSERGAWGVGIEAAAAFARRWVTLRRSTTGLQVVKSAAR